MAGSKDNALETYVLNLLAGKETSLPTHWRIRHLITSATPETGVGNVYSSAGTIPILSSELTVSGNSLVVNTQKDTPTGVTTNETILRRVLEFSADNFSTILGAYYSADVLDADDATVTGVTVPTGTILRVPANTGFAATED